MELRLHTFWITGRWSLSSHTLHKGTLGICLIEGWMSLLEKDRNVTLLRIMLQSFRLIATHFTNSTIMTHCFVYHKRDALFSVILNLYLSIIYSFCRVLQACVIMMSIITSWILWLILQGCGKRFTEYSSLYKHHMVHTQQKPFYCSVCTRHYRQASTLTMHKRTAHGIVEADDGTEIVLGETVFALANATSGSAGSKKVNSLGSNVSSSNTIRNKQDPGIWIPSITEQL